MNRIFQVSKLNVVNNNFTMAILPISKNIVRFYIYKSKLLSSISSGQQENTCMNNILVMKFGKPGKGILEDSFHHHKGQVLLSKS